MWYKEHIKKEKKNRRKVTNKDKYSCKNCQTICSVAKKNCICDNFVLTHIENK